MTRLMGDATHAAVPVLARVPGLEVVAGYDSGTPDIDWTPADWARFPGLPQVHIDQAFNSTINTQAHAIVFDVEPGAYQPGQAGQLIDRNVTPRPTIYVNRSNLATTLASAQQSANFRGDVWLSFPGWQPGQALPPLPPGCQYVAIQNQLDVAGAYDLSDVLDPYWPLPEGMLVKILDIDRSTVPAGVNWPGQWLLRGDGAVVHIQTEAQLAAYQNAGVATVSVSYGDWQALAGVS